VKQQYLVIDPVVKSALEFIAEKVPTVRRKDVAVGVGRLARVFFGRGRKFDLMTVNLARGAKANSAHGNSSAAGRFAKKRKGGKRS